VTVMHLSDLTAAMTSFARVAASSLSVLLLNACVVIPTDFVGTHKGVPESVVRAIEPGTTTRADILLQLSEPWIRGKGDGYFVYSWVESLGGGATVGAVSPVGLVGGVVETSFRCHCLVVQFSALGQVERITTLTDAGTAVDMTVFPCPDERVQEAIQQWLAKSPARP